MTKKIFMIAGPNGGGKTTTAMSLIASKEIDEFLNADEIARGLAPVHPESVSLAASKLLLKRLRELLGARKNFSFETTASGTNYIKYLKEAQEVGYIIYLMFLWLPGPDLAIERVAHRVKQGGHFIPEDVIRRRYYTGLKNLLTYYLPIANQALILDNAVVGSTKVIVRKHADGNLEIKKPIIWEEIREQVYGK